MTYFRLGVGLTVVWLVLWLFVVDAQVDDWWGGPAVFGLVVLLYWALGRQFFPGTEELLLPGETDDDYSAADPDSGSEEADSEDSEESEEDDADSGVPASLGDPSASD